MKEKMIIVILFATALLSCAKKDNNDNTTAIAALAIASANAPDKAITFSYADIKSYYAPDADLKFTPTVKSGTAQKYTISPETTTGVTFDSKTGIVLVSSSSLALDKAFSFTVTATSAPKGISTSTATISFSIKSKTSLTCVYDTASCGFTFPATCPNSSKCYFQTDACKTDSDCSY